MAESATTKKTTSAGTASAPAKETMITIKLPLTKEEKEPVFVSVNEKTWLIKRGVNVEVPMSVYEVLRRQEKLLNEAIEYEASVQSR